MSCGSGSTSDHEKVEVILEAQEQESSEDPPMEEWSSIEILLEPENPKIAAYEKGLFDPGSGEVCTKYIAMSASEVFRHPYYNFPGLTDPGIMEALLQPEPQKTYSSDGQELYLAICKEMSMAPVKIFYRGLLTDSINLKYYCVRPDSVRAMAKALEYNEYVQVLNLTDNFLNDDACFHLGDMLLENKSLVELVLSGCRIRPSGLRRILKNMSNNKTLKVLNLNKNQLGDEGAEILANSLIFGCKLDEIYLSYNGITGKGAAVLADALETYNDFRVIDLSWNTLLPPGVNMFLSRLSENVRLQELDLSWNSFSEPKIADFIAKCLVKCTELLKVNLSNNKFSGTAIKAFSKALLKNKKLSTFDLSFNPLTTEDALTLLDVLRFKQVKIKNLLLDDVIVSEGFVNLLTEIKELKFRKNVIVTHGYVRPTYRLQGPDRRELLLNRIDYICKSKKGAPVDFALVCLQQHKDKVQYIEIKMFNKILRQAGVMVDEDLLSELLTVFPGPGGPKDKSLDVPLIVDYLSRKWPDRKLPPTPPPEPVPEPTPEKKKK